MDNRYNERLFNKGKLRSYFHLARFTWLKKNIERYCPEIRTAIEQGCYDGKSVAYLPSRLTKYAGYDANWENGLDIGRDFYTANETIHFLLCQKLEDFNPSNERFDISLSLETMEHLPTNDLQGYIEKLHHSTSRFLFVTVPNEKGIVLLIKYMINKMLLIDKTMRHTWKELWHGILGQTHKIKREELGHKGFDYDTLLNAFLPYFELVKAEGIPFGFLPKSLNFNIGLIYKPKEML